MSRHYHGAASSEAEGRADWSASLSVLPYLWPADRFDLRLRVVISLVALVAAKLVTVTVPFFYKLAVDELGGEASNVPAWVQFALVPAFLVISYGVARILMVAFAQLRDALFAKVGQSAVRALAVRTFEHLHSLSLRYHLERRTGALSRVVERGTRAVEMLLRTALFSVIPTLIELVLVAIILAWVFDLRYAAVTGVTVVAYVLFTFFTTEWRTKIRREMNESDNRANTRAIDSLLNFETVKYFNNEEHEVRRFDQAWERYEDAAIRTTTSLSFLNTGQSVIYSCGLIVVMLMAAQGVVEGTLTIGDFVMANTFLIQLYQPLNLIGFVYREIRQSIIDMETMFSLLGVPAEVRDAPDARPLRVDGGKVTFEDVRFAYEPDRPILKGISFEVPAGKTVAIVGPSGAGKSTISRLLFRFYDVQSGSIKIDGQDITTVTQRSLREAIGIVPQDTVLFNDTIGYNIRYGRPGASEEEVRQAAANAQIHDFVDHLPKGYQTIVGERGLKLSGGEKQRVAIARTLLKNPPILLLDEATSALDSHTEKEIQAALSDISRGRTTLVIAHRLSTVVDADEIIVLEAGEIIERGTHMALLEKGGAYAALWNRQQETAAAAELLEKEGETAVSVRDDALT